MSVLNITKDNFEQEVINSPIPVLLDFWAPWCGPCRMVGPIVEELSKEVEGLAKVGKVNVDDELELAQSFGIVSIPTIIIFKDGVPIKNMVGFKGKNDIRVMLGV